MSKKDRPITNQRRITMKGGIREKAFRRFTVYFVKDHQGTFDEQYALAFGIVLPRSYAKQGPEFAKMLQALNKGDSVFLAKYFSSVGFSLIEVNHSFGTDIGFLEPKAFLRLGPEADHLGFIDWFQLEARSFDSRAGNEECTDPNSKVRPWMEDPSPFAAALAVHNAFNPTNQTSLIRFNDIFSRLRDIQQSCWLLDTPSEASPLFVSRVHMKLRRRFAARASVASINGFYRDYLWPNRHPKGVTAYANQFEDFLGNLLDVQVHDLSELSLISVCQNCASVFPYVRSKLYCTKQCGKSTRNRRTYKRRRRPPLS